MGHTLDIVAMFNKNPEVSNVDVNQYDISHHFLIDFTVTCSPEVHEFKTIKYRKANGIGSEKFSSEIKERWNGIQEGESFGDRISRFNEIKKDTLDKHAPLHSKTIKNSTGLAMV